MPFELMITLAVFAAVVLGLLQERIGPEVVMLTGLLTLVACGVLELNEALSGFANPSVIAIASLYVIGAGLRSTGGLESLSLAMLGRPSARTPLLRLLAPISALSAVMNNTPLVAFFMPIFVQLAKRLRISPSRLLIPLSYAAILGGCCTLVGTSTNLVVDSILRKQPGQAPMSMFELTPVGLPIAMAGLLYLATIGRRLLPEREDLLEHLETHPREYIVEMLVREACPLIGKSVREAGLRDLPGLYLYRIERQEKVISPVSPTESLRLGDILCFSGIASTVVDLQKIRGLDPIDHRPDYRPLYESQSAPAEAEETAQTVPHATTTAASTAGGKQDSAASSHTAVATARNATNLSANPGLGNGTGQSLDSFEGLPPKSAAPELAAAPRMGRQLCEVVISSTSPLLGVSICEANFRTRYNASVLAVHRSGEKLEQKIGKIVLHAGDTLLIDADDDFLRRWRHSPDFILVSGVDDSAPVAHERAWLALLIFAGVVLGMSFTANPVLVALIGAVLMVLTGCVQGNEGQRSIELSVILLVGAALGISRALESSGAAEWLAHGLLSVSQNASPVIVLAIIYLLTVTLSEFLSNNACAAMMGSLAIAAAAELNLDPRPFLITVAVAASCAFATPIGYQTNLMVLNAGGYRFIDYLRVGLPMNILCMIVAVTLIPWLWPLQ